MRNLLLFTLACTLLFGAGAPLLQNSPAQTGQVKPSQRTAAKTSRAAQERQNGGEMDGESLMGTVKAIDDVPVPAQESGPVSKVLLKEGDSVTEGQLLVEMDATTAKLEQEAAVAGLEAAMAKAEDPSEIEYANASLDLAIAELDQKLSINKERKGVISEADIRKLRFAQTKAEKGVTAAMTARDIARKTALVEKAKVSVAAEKVKRLMIQSPLDGVVSSMLAQKGAWVNAGDPVAQVTRMDRLRVDFRIDTAEHNPADLIGRKISATLALAGGKKEEFSGEITVISPIAQMSSYLAQCEIENRQEKGQWLLRPGLSVEVRIGK